MAKPAFNWQKFEDAMVVQAEGAVRTVMKQYPDESFYAVAFHEFYSESHYRVLLPTRKKNLMGTTTRGGVLPTGIGSIFPIKTDPLSSFSRHLTQPPIPLTLNIGTSFTIV